MIEYADFECPLLRAGAPPAQEAGADAGLPALPGGLEAPARASLAHAAEAAALQGRFWEFHDSLLEDQGRLDDPHLWARCEELGLDLDRFEADRRSEAVAERVQRDFRSGIRAGVTTTPTLFVDGQAFPGIPEDTLLSALRYA